LYFIKNNTWKIQKTYKILLAQNDFSKLHFEVQDLKSYFDRHKAQASKAHTHGFYQLIWFTVSGTHYVDYEKLITRKTAYLLVLTKFILSAHIRTTRVLIHFNDFFINQFNPELAQRFSLSVLTKLDNPTSRLKTLRSIASTAFYSKKKNI
jgi:hypothetical protein